MANPDALAAAIGGLLDDDRARLDLRNRGPERAQLFSAERAGCEYISLLRKLEGVRS